MIDPATAKQALLRARAALAQVATIGAEAAKPVALDQARVGRVSRMDALQAQAMSLEAERRRVIQRQRIESALARIEAGEYGDCVRCGDPIDERRLAFDPAVLLCIACADDSER